MTDEYRVAIALDEFQDPVIAYEVEDDEPRITEANGAFESVFGSLSSETPVATIFDQFSAVNSAGNEDPVTHLTRGDGVGIYLDGFAEGGPFFARVLSSDADTGYVVFQDLDECLDIAKVPTVDPVSSVISHDLRNPLDVAKAHLRAARETGAPEHFDAVANAHERMEQIIRDVRTITRDRIAVDPSDNVSIEAAAKDAWKSVRTEHATLYVTDPLPTPTADPDHIQRLFENLFRNAVEHGSTGNPTQSGDSVNHGPSSSREGVDDTVEHGSDVDDQPLGQEQKANSACGVTITVGALDNGFYVADDGPGIPPEEQDVVFESRYSTREGGTGLGLAIVERIVAAHDWELALTTAANGGARFEVRF